MENLIIRILTRIFDLVLLNILWMLCSLPIITLGASTTALYSVMFAMVGGEEGYILKDFMHAFRNNFSQGTAAWLLLISLGTVIWADMRIVQNVPGILGRVGEAVFGAVFILWFVEFVFIFPIIAKFQNSLKNMIKNAFLIPAARLPYALLILAMTGLCIGVTLLNQTTIMTGAVIWSTTGVSLLTYADSLVLRKMLEPYLANHQIK